MKLLLIYLLAKQMVLRYILTRLTLEQLLPFTLTLKSSISASISLTNFRPSMSLRQLVKSAKSELSSIFDHYFVSHMV